MTTHHTPATSLPDRIARIETHSLRLRDLLAARASSAPRQPTPGLLFGSLEQVVLTYGRAFATARHPADQWRGQMGQCFHNARVLAQLSAGSEDPFLYCEGYAQHARQGVVYEHAWVIDRAGRVIDPTWTDPEACGYMGVTLTLAHIGRADRRGVTGHLGVSYGDLYSHGLPATALAA